MKNFNFSLTDNTTYTGKDAEGFYSLALLSAPTVKNVTIVPNVKSSIKLAKFDLGNIVQSDSTTWNATGEGTLVQSTFTVCPKKVNLEFARSTFEQNYLNEYMKAGTGEQVMPDNFQSYITNKVAEKVSADLEKAYWGGNVNASYPYNICNGVELALTGSGVVNVTAAASSAITVSTIIAEISKVYSAITSAILSRGEVKIFMATNMVKLFKQAIADASAELYYTKDAPLNFLGIDIVEAPGMTSFKMVAAEPNNLLWLTDLISDAEDVSILPMRNTLGTPTVRFVADFKFGTGILYLPEVVYYS